MKRILLNRKRSKNSADQNQFIAVNTVGSNKLLPYTDMLSVINAKNRYDYERETHNLIRFTCNVNTICSNVLFNTFTEIVKDEGSDDATCLNFEDVSDSVEDSLHNKRTTFFSGPDRVYNAIDDTQLSNNACGYVYHCGLDFFNNHILRSNTFKAVNMDKDDTEDDFNTIKDYHRTHDGTKISDPFVIGDRDLKNSKLHIYTHDNILDFDDAFSQRLKEENGWFGFINKGKIVTYNYNNDDEKTDMLDISKPLNNERSCTFIDMYPTRDLYNFAPKYNPHRHRVEKNWNYCLTYPSSSTTSGISFINSDVEGGALRIFLIDDITFDTFKINCMCKHGLVEGDYVNIYSGNVLTIPSVEVLEIVDEYTFKTSSNGFALDTDWQMVDFSPENDYTVSGYTSYVVYKDEKYYQNQKANFLTYSFKKIDNDSEVDYYVRILSKIPNWKNADKKVTEYSIYEEDTTMIPRYSSGISKSNADVFENHVSKLAFSNNIYNDGVGKVIFTDDININYLHDNLGRYLSSFYFTIVKNNKGYRDWYKNNVTNTKDIEYSHCFGKITCGFYLNPNMYEVNKIRNNEYYPLNNIRTMCSNNYLNGIDGAYTSYSGLCVSNINDAEHRGLNDDDDEINYEKNLNFYGELCCYSHTNVKETIIQKIDYRFNTAQRENWGNNQFKYTNLEYDDYDENEFSMRFLYLNQSVMNNNLEGYYYQPHYEVRIRTFDDNLTVQYPKIFSIRKRIWDGNEMTITTNKNNFFEKNDYFIIYDRKANKKIHCQITDVVNYNIFKCRFVDSVDSGLIGDEPNSSYRVVRADASIPNNAEMLLDGTCRFVWREMYENGFDTINSSNIETYPFTNGRLYVNTNIILYLRRQNPTLLTKVLYNANFDKYAIKGNFIPNTELNYYITANNIVC